MLAITYMENPIDSFRMQGEDFKALETHFPQWKWYHCTNEKEFLQKLNEATICFCWQFKAPYYNQAHLLQHIFTPAAGHDWIASPPAEHKVKIHHGTFHGRMIAESFFAMLFHFNNRLSLVSELKELRSWPLNAWTGRKLLSNQNLLIVGYGHIGEQIAQKAQLLGIHCAGVRRCVEKSTQAPCPIYAMEELKEQLAIADHVLLLLPSSARGVFSHDMLESMKQGAYLYNFGRGGTIADKDIASFLHSGHLAGAGLDVCEKEPLEQNSELWEAPNLLLTPHSSCCYQEYKALFISEVKETLKAIQL